MCKILKFFNSFVCALLISNCAPHYTVCVDSIGSGYGNGVKYFLIPGKKREPSDDLKYKEFSSYVHHALQQKGYVKSSNSKDADICVVINYIMSAPWSHDYSYSSPVYGQTGVSSSYTTGSLYNYGNRTAYSGITTYTPTYGVVGSRQNSGTMIRFTSVIKVTAIDLNVYRRTNKEEPLWTTTIASTDAEGDSRQAFPVMVAAAAPYFGVNTGREVSVSISERDKRVAAVKGASP